MKNRLNYFLSVVALVGALASCKKDENRISYENGTPPVLTATFQGAQSYTQTDSAKPFIRLAWTNPNYRFTTGTSSQDVTYVLQVDTTGSNFTNPKKKEVSIAKSLDSLFTTRAFNSLFADWAENKPHNFELRIKSQLGSSAAIPLYSNVIKMTVTPYLDVAAPLPPTDMLYLTGSAMPSDWTNTPPAAQKATPDPASLTSTGRPTIYIFDNVSFVSGKNYKFLSTPGNWQPQYGGKADGTGQGGGDLGYNLGGGSDPDAIPTPGSGGSYKITVNFKSGKYIVEKK